MEQVGLGDWTGRSGEWNERSQWWGPGDGAGKPVEWMRGVHVLPLNQNYFTSHTAMPLIVESTNISYVSAASLQCTLVTTHKNVLLLVRDCNS